MSNLNDFYNNNSNGNNNNNTNNTDSINDFFNTNPNQELEIEDTRNLVDAPDLNYKKEIDNKPSRQINDNSNIINQNSLPNARFEREYHFDDGSDKKTIIKNIVLISIVIIVGFFLVYNYSGVRDTSPQQETPVEANSSTRAKYSSNTRSTSSTRRWNNNTSRRWSIFRSKYIKNDKWIRHRTNRKGTIL